MSIRSKLCRGLVAAAGVIGAAAASASGQAYSPIAFGPLGGLPSGQYFTSVIDIAGSGQTFIGVTNLGTAVFRTPGQDYTLAGGGSPYSLSRNGQTVGGGTFGSAPRRWDIANAVGNVINSTAITLPPSTFVTSPAYNVNSNGTHFAFPTPTSIVFGSTFRTANSAFLAVNIGAFAGAYRGIASDAPIMTVLGHIPGNDTNAYMWNYETDAIVPYQMPAGAGSISPGNVGGAISADGSRAGGTASIGPATLPYWWDNGVPHAVPLLPGSVVGSVLAMNYTGTLAGGQMTFTGGLGNRAFLTELDTGIVYNLHEMYSAAGLLPAGWILRSTQHISDDGSRIFCLATAPDGTQRIVDLQGNFVPAPGPVALLAVGGLVALRRRRD